MDQDSLVSKNANAFMKPAKLDTLRRPIAPKLPVLLKILEDSTTSAFGLAESIVRKPENLDFRILEMKQNLQRASARKES